MHDLRAVCPVGASDEESVASLRAVNEERVKKGVILPSPASLYMGAKTTTEPFGRFSTVLKVCWTRGEIETGNPSGTKRVRSTSAAATR